jgi:hypothetical protein
LGNIFAIIITSTMKSFKDFILKHK